ncbi:hypothetical protein BDR07DRAFT_1423954 [Suillus spraguei]|nr:hypothetical protein BDR07DRAFT_1423954 [Suillus spraguei]
MTVLYLSVRYLGILYSMYVRKVQHCHGTDELCFTISFNILDNVPTILLTDTRCWILYILYNWTNVLVMSILGVIIITRLHAMYQRSRKILLFLVVTFLAVIIFSGVVAVMITMYSSGEELILSGTYQCTTPYKEVTLLLNIITWIVGTVWEVLALCLATWIAVKRFNELRQHSAGGIIGHLFVVLMKTHMVYFASFVVVSCCRLISFLSPNSFDQNSLSAQIYEGFLQIFPVVQMFVLGPRLILGVRAYHTKLVADSDAATSSTSIAFQERVQISAGNGV